MPAPQKLTPQQQRDKRAKIMLGVLAIPFLGLLAFQLPKIMKAGGGGAPPPASVTATTPAGSGTAATAGAAAFASASAPATGQLVRFSQFAPKNPFAAKVADTSASPGPTSSAGSGSGVGSSTTPTVTPVAPKKTAIATKPITVSVKQSPTKPTAPVGPQVPAAMMMVNGKKRVLALDAGFPAQHPLFRIVALSKDSVWIGLVGGTFSNGSHTLKIQRGRKVTLLNTTAGQRYVITLVKPTTAPAPPVVVKAKPKPTPAAPTTTTPSPTTTIPTTGATG